MKILKVLKQINTFALAAYIPYIIIDFDTFFFGKEKGNGILALSLFMFAATFICGGTILVICNKRNITSSVSISEITNISKSKLIALFTIYIIGLILIISQVHNEIVIFYIAVSSVTFAFIIAENILIPKIDVSPFYKISLPWYLYPIPFVVFLGGNFIQTQIVPEEKQGLVAIILLISAGIMLAALAWHGSIIVNEELKTIEKNKGIVSEFRTDTIKIISYKNINSVKKSGIYYIITSGDDKLKINRLYSGTKRFEKTLNDNNIIIE